MVAGGQGLERGWAGELMTSWAWGFCWDDENALDFGDGDSCTALRLC